MQVNKKLHRQQRLQTWTFVLLFLIAIGLLAWLSTRYHFQSDWTAGNRHTLSEATITLLEKMEGPVKLTSFSRADDLSGLRKRTRELVNRYRRIKKELTLEFLDPDQHPEKVRTLGITLDGELRVEYDGRAENLKNIGEQSLTNALQRLLRSGERRVLFLSGHGERRIDGQANHDLGEWGKQMSQKGFRFDSLNLGATPSIPDNTAALVIAGPQVELLPGEVSIIQNYVLEGGNLLWLTEPGELNGLAPLAEQLGISFEPGLLVDPTGQMLGIDNPAFIVVAEYPEHPVTEELTTLTLFPEAQALKVEGETWQSTALLRSLPRSWSETGPMEGSISFDEGEDLPGPLTLGVALSREQGNGEQTTEQRIAVIGDGDFLANSFLGNGANQELGARLLNWLSGDDQFISIPPRAAPDTQLELSKSMSLVIGFGFLLILPGILLGSGLTIWWKRRKR
ncbi:MAG: GldG family protein [Pseudomonadota bacterium]